MNFTVDWLPDAEQELARLWLQAPDRATIRRSAHLLDLQLADDPISTAESRPNGRCIARPLAVL